MVSITADTVVSNCVSMMPFFYGGEHSGPIHTAFMRSVVFLSHVKAIRFGRALHFKMKLLQRIAWNRLSIVLMAITAKGMEGGNIIISLIFDNSINSASSMNK